MTILAKMFPILAVSLMAQSTGTVVVTTSISAVAGTDPATQVSCLLTPASGNVHVTCSVAGSSVHTSDNKSVPGNANGYVGSVVANGNSVTWLIQQPVAAGPINWQVAANGVMKQGSF